MTETLDSEPRISYSFWVYQSVWE